MQKENSISQIYNRKKIAALVKKVLLGELKVSLALKEFPKDSEDKSVNIALYALTHLEADEDIRAKDALYKREQDDYLMNLAEILEEGYPVPQNIISEYEEYYKESPLYPTMTKENIIKRLKKFINF